MRSDHPPIIMTLGLALSLSSAGLQADSSPRQVRTWAASCAACHGTDGQAQKGALPLSGRPGDELYRILLAFKAGERPATVMHQHAKGYTDAELKQLANWFAAQSDR
jgi:cytochrome subunit of sulfide dehydrogenase